MELHLATFVVLDLETTGGSAESAEITEIGAVKISGGEIIGEFQTLINPQTPIPAFISLLTGITDPMVATAPSISEVLPTFFEFCGSESSTFLVAHNAPFDISFLKAAAEKSGRSWPKYKTLDTAKIARRVLTKDEVPNNKLSTLAPYFGAISEPNHRALADAKATVDVFHGLIDRLGSFGVKTIEDLIDFSHRLTPAQQSKRHLLEGLPKEAGVYIFRDSKDQALYIGTSKNIAQRVRNYFSSSEARKRVLEMIAIAERIEAISTPTVIEAEILELRLIHQLKPRYNRRSKFPEKKVWLKLTREQFSRLSIVRGFDSLDDHSGWAGPFSGIEEAQSAKEAIYEVEKIRQCTVKITTKSMALSSPCALYEMKRCDAPCIGAQSADSYLSIRDTVHELLHGASTLLENQLIAKMSQLAQDQRFEEALILRNRLGAFARGVGRGQHIRSLARVKELIVKIADEIVLIRYGKLAGSERFDAGENIERIIENLLLTGEIVNNDQSILPSGNYEESEKLIRSINHSSELLYIDESDGPWQMSIASAAAIRHRLLDNLSDRFGQSERVDRMSNNPFRT